MKTAIIFLADGTEECEAFITADLLKRASIHVVTASVMGRTDILSSHKIRITADICAEDADYDSADILVLPGGLPGVHYIGGNKCVCEQVKCFALQGKYVAAICAAPGVLSSLGLLRGKRATVYPDCSDTCPDALLVNEKSVVDGHIITGQSLGGAFEFALAIIRTLLNDETAEKVRHEIYY